MILREVARFTEGIGMVRNPSPVLQAHFAHLEDPRVERTRLHNLLDIVFIALCAVVSGANDFVGMAKFGRNKQAWLRKFLELPRGIPSHDTFNRVLSALAPASFLDCFLSWVEALQVRTAGRIVGIDGKTVRASLDRAKGQNPLHVVSAWAVQNRLVLGQEVVDEKSNEITAIPKLLEVLELAGAIVTIDAMGCQKEIAAKVREKGADYVLAVKGNQEHLEEDVVAAFAAVDDGRSDHRPRRHTERDANHGREELRWYEALPVPEDLRGAADWKDLRSLCRVTRVYKEKGEEKSEVRYFISSLRPEVKALAHAVRGHWGIENGLHWVLDMYFAEDRSRARTAHAAANLALMRRWVISLLRQNTSVVGSIEKKRLQAAWSDEAREKLLGLFSEN
jgi:predicted transposase YbfD/YdcC